MKSPADVIKEIQSLSHKQLMVFAARLQMQANAAQRDDAIAIVGMAGSFPGEDPSLEGFWALQREGGDASREVPLNRWNVHDYFDPDLEADGKSYARFASFLEDVEHFDAAEAAAA